MTKLLIPLNKRLNIHTATVYYNYEILVLYFMLYILNLLNIEIQYILMKDKASILNTNQSITICFINDITYSLVFYVNLLKK
jgi:hypothetical protein